VGQPLKRMEDPPEFQMFLPGFAARRLPLELTNINDVRYREDGKVVALAYDGNIYLLSDTDGDGLEDKAELFWEAKGNLVAPIGMALTPPGYKHGRGVFVAAKGKVSLIVDTDGDDKADKETIVASGWPGTFHQVDALGVALAPDGSIYFGLGTSNFANPFLTDKVGKSGYDVKGERGTILRVSPDFSKREIICTGIRFPVGMAFNALGDLFATDQEGATWMANGNPFDELLHIQPGRHYGFPPRHPTYLPDVIDEPSVFDYAPQHQSTCGLLFNEPVNKGPVFGPAGWRGDAIICGESRGKLYRTQLVKTPAGYIASNRIIASMPALMIDSCVSPKGDLLITTHSGNPDWGSGPTGKGRLYKISYADREAPQPVLCYAASPGEVRVVFDRPLDSAALEGLAKRVSIDYGAYVGAGDRFEKMYPGYAAVKRQMRSPRESLAVTGVQISPDRRTLVVHTPPQTQAVPHALTIENPGQRAFPAGGIQQLNCIDLGYDLTGVVATWQPADAQPAMTIWLPHLDPAVAQGFTGGSIEHERFWKLLKQPGRMTLQTSVDLWDMLRPAVQPGSKLDHTFPPERVTITVESNAPVNLESPNLAPTMLAQGRTFSASVTVSPKQNEPVPLRIVVSPPSEGLQLRVFFTTSEDARPRALQLRRFLLPWARQTAPAEDVKIDIPELAGGNWLRGRELFYGNQAGCSMCHSVRGEGSDLGPDLSNLIHRDYESVLRDLRDPSGALNPEYIGSIVKLKDGRVLSGIVRNVDADHFLVRGDAAGEKVPIARSAVASIKASSLSVMPKGLPEGLGKEKVRDILTFLLTEPLAPAPPGREGAPPPRSYAEVDAVLNSASPTTRPGTSLKPLNIVLVSGPKDHGPGEHDYPLFQQRWSTLMSLAPNVTVSQAENWPTPEQWARANVVVFYSDNPAWKADKAAEVDAFLKRGGGLVYIHYAVDGHDAPEALAERIGLVWRGGASKFRHGPLELTVRDTHHPITRGFANVKFYDESYWQLSGDPSRINVLADGVEEGSPRPLLWTIDKSPGRVFVSIPGHFTWTFDDPLYRILLLRGIAWTAGESVDRLTDLATIGARVQP
jgi:putative heme-binding domain-containing protein